MVVEIARAMEEYCADAVLLNLTNPLTVLTRAVSKATSIVSVGLCHELFSTLGMLSTMFEVPEESINVRVAGVNHFIWVTEVAVHGRDVTGEAFRRISGGEAREISLSDERRANPDRAARGRRSPTSWPPCGPAKTL